MTDEKKALLEMMEALDAKLDALNANLETVKAKFDSVSIKFDLVDDKLGTCKGEGMVVEFETGSVPDDLEAISEKLSDIRNILSSVTNRYIEFIAREGGDLRSRLDRALLQEEETDMMLEWIGRLSQEMDIIKKELNLVQ